MPLHWLRSKFAPPARYTAQRPGATVNVNVPEQNIRTMRELFGEPVRPGKTASAASLVQSNTAILHFAPDMGFNPEQADRIAEQLSAAVAALKASASVLTGLPKWGTHYPGAVVLDEDGPASVHTNGTHPVPVLRVKGLSKKQRAGVAHEVSHTTFRLLKLDRDTTHDHDGGTFASTSILSGMGR